MEKTLKAFQREQAIKCYNDTWGFIDLETRSPDEELNMIHAAHTSRYLWGQVGEPIHFERGEWQIAKVYAILGKGEQALYHAETCLKICMDNDIADFDIAFAYEAIANAYKTIGNAEKVEQYKKKAYDAVPGIKKEDDKEYTLSELEKI